MGDRLRAGKPRPHYFTVFSGTLNPTQSINQSPSHPGQLSLLPSAGREVSTGQRAGTLCGWGVQAGVVHSTCG